MSASPGGSSRSGRWVRYRPTPRPPWGGGRPGVYLDIGQQQPGQARCCTTGASPPLQDRRHAVHSDHQQRPNSHRVALAPPLGDEQRDEEETDDEEVGGEEVGGAVEDGDQDSDVGGKQGEEDASLVQLEPEVPGGGLVAEEGVEQGGVEEGKLVAEELQEGAAPVPPLPRLDGCRVVTRCR